MKAVVPIDKEAFRAEPAV